MEAFLVLIAVAGLGLSLVTCGVSKGSVHEIAAIIWLLISVVALVGYAVLKAIRIATKTPPPAPPRKP